MLLEWWQIWRATRRVKRLDRLYGKDIQKAKRQGRASADIENLESEASSVLAEEWAERDRLVTVSLRRAARLLNVPVPDRKDPEMWHEEDNYHYRPTLTAKGISTLRTAIREERQARGLYSKIVFAAVAAAISAIAAIVGAIASLVGILK